MSKLLERTKHTQEETTVKRSKANKEIESVTSQPSKTQNQITS
jgi:hypothetical protein